MISHLIDIRIAILALTFYAAGTAIQSGVNLDGSIKDQNGAALFNAEVQLLNLASGRLLKTKSDMEGAYKLTGLPPGVFIRSGDALHLATAEYAGFSEVWTNDRHMLNAASHFGVKGRTISKS